MEARSLQPRCMTADDPNGTGGHPTATGSSNPAGKPMSELTRRAALALGALAVVASSPRLTFGDARYPSRTIKFIVPYAAGGLPDTVARIFARSVQDRIGGPVIVENRPGANGNVAAAALTAAPADGYTFVVSDCAILTINPLIYAKLSY